MLESASAVLLPPGKDTHSHLTHQFNFYHCFNVWYLTVGCHRRWWGWYNREVHLLILHAQFSAVISLSSVFHSLLNDGTRYNSPSEPSDLSNGKWLCERLSHQRYHTLTSYPGDGFPIEPGLIFIPLKFPQISTCNKCWIWGFFKIKLWLVHTVFSTVLKYSANSEYFYKKY